MKKLFSSTVSILLCCILVLLLSSCGKENSDPQSPFDGTKPLQYNLHISVDFEENWFFSTYDVYLEIDTHKKKMKHGNDYELDYQLEPGAYTLTFRSAEDDGIFKAVELNIQGDTRAKYKISCDYDKISVTTKSVETPDAVKENQAMLPLSSSSCKGKDYQKIITSFSEAGFTNISTNILYDIVWGITSEGEVEKISINGNSKFTKGDIFDKDVEIIITYHMDEDKDPNKETEPPKIIVTMNEDDFILLSTQSAEKKLREMGFSEFEYETIETDEDSSIDGKIAAVEIKSWTFGKGNFARGDTYESDAIVVLWSYEYIKPEKPIENLTVDNCPDLAAILSNKAEIDQSYASFASKYNGRIIEFDGRIDYCAKHGSYSTRFDYLVSAGDYNPNHQIGPSFKFEDVSYYDLNTNLDTVRVGLNVRIIAKVVSFDQNSGLFYLEPVSVTSR